MFYLNGKLPPDNLVVPPALLAKNCKYWFKSPISPYSIIVQGGCSAVQTPKTLQILGSDRLAKNLTSLKDSIELNAGSVWARSALILRTITTLSTLGMMSSRPSVSYRLIWKSYIVNFIFNYDCKMFKVTSPAWQDPKISMDCREYRGIGTSSASLQLYAWFILGAMFHETTGGGIWIKD